MEKYKIICEIGSGSFGKVYRAERLGLDRKTVVALKKISKGARQEREINSLRQECEIQKNLRHPNIIQMLDSFETDDSVIIVTEYAKYDLHNLLHRHGSGNPHCFSIKDVQLYAGHLVSALYFLHSHRILHRDIKPQNVLIGWDEMAKLCDFGFARQVEIQDFLVISCKGTPLYMAPEVVDQKPYDHNADLWSLGCILYELLVGVSPFSTHSLSELVLKMHNNDIHWPSTIDGDCLSFLKGLLQKDPQKRLTWPGLLDHPFVRDNIYIDHNAEQFPLTKALSPSQEIAKEKQRENLQKKLASYRKIIEKATKRLEQAQKEIKRCSEEGKGIKTPLASPGVPNTAAAAGALPLLNYHHTGFGVPPRYPYKAGPNFHPAMMDVNNLRMAFQNIKINADRQGVRFKGNDQDHDGNSGTSSCETMSSSSDSGSDDESDEADNNTVIMDNQKRDNKNKDKYHGSSDHPNPNGLADLETNRTAKPSSRVGSGPLWKSGALFTLHSFGSEDKPINSDEWIYFIVSTMKEILDNPRSLCEKHFLTMLVAPLRNHLAEPEVVEKIAALLSMPFTLDKSAYEQDPKLKSQLQSLYLDTKVLPNLFYSCILIVRRRKPDEPESLTLEDFPAILTVEDIEGLEKCVRLIACLVHMDEDYVTQFCDSVCLLRAFPVIQLFLKLDGVRSGLTADVVAILCHILRTLPANKNIVEEVMLGSDESVGEEELWRLIKHSNPDIQSRSLRVFTYLCLFSERVKTEFLIKQKPNVWKILRRAAISPHQKLRETAEFALQCLQCNSNSATYGKSFSTAPNSGCPSHGGPQASASVSNASENGNIPQNSALKGTTNEVSQNKEQLNANQESSVVRDSGHVEGTEGSR